MCKQPEDHPEPLCAHDKPQEHASTAPVWADTLQLARVWATTTIQLSHQLDHTPVLRAWALQTVAQVFLALSHEESASAQYHLVGNRLRYPPSVVAEGIELSLSDLHEAALSWAGVDYWLERIANHHAAWLQQMAQHHAEWLQHRTAHRTDPDLLEVVRPCITQARTQQQRVWALVHALQEEHAVIQQRAERWQQREAHV